ncbi:MAG: helix-turn-helix transcriptional regulator [Solibacillus sp.]|uniref:helix-turn-helix domain-containing protein n=1 Tax=Solibacillus sp. FSL H8-0523 TaxID=2954511 RepID=UPI003100AA44
MQYGPILKALRIKAEMTQEELAQRLNRSRSCISKFESEKKVIDLPTFLQWIRETNSQEVAVAMFFGMDALNVVNTLLPMIPVALPAFITPLIDAAQFFM